MQEQLNALRVELVTEAIDKGLYIPRGTVGYGEAMTTSTRTSEKITRTPQPDGSTKVTKTTTTSTLDRDSAPEGEWTEGDYEQTLTTVTKVDVEYEGGTPPGENHNPVLTVTISPTSGQSPLPVAFAASALDPDGDTNFTYAWTFGDGTTSSAASLSKTLTTVGDFTWGVTVSDGKGGTDSETGIIAVSAPPPPQTKPTPYIKDSNLYRADGTRVIVKGFEQYFTAPENPVGAMGKTLPEMIRAKPSALRILPNPPATPQADIVAGVKFLTDNNVLVDLAFHDGTLTDLPYYAQYKPILAAYEKNIVLHHGESYAATDQAWGDACISFTNAIRSQGWKAPILHYAREGGRNWACIRNQAARVFAADPLGNTGFGVQLYWSGNTYTDIDTTNQIYQQHSGCSLRQAVDQIDAFPYYVQVGLCGDQPDYNGQVKVPWKGLIDYIEGSHPEVPWLWWGWNSSGPGNMTMNYIWAGPLSNDTTPPNRTVGTWNFNASGSDDAKFVAETVLKARKS